MGRKFITRAKLARKLRLSRSRITQLVQEGVIKTVDCQGRWIDGKTAVEAVRARLDRRIKLKRSEQINGDKQLSLWK
jgi:hypothetical protein